MVLSKVTKMFLSLPLILVLFLMTYFWNSLYTNSSSHAGSVLSKAITSLLIKSNADTQSSDLSYNIFFPAKLDPKQELQDYINETLQSEESPYLNASKLYSESITSKYPSYLIPQEQLAPTPLGNLLTTLHIPVFNIQAELRSISANFMQISVFTGLLAILFFKNKKPFDLEYLLLCFGSLFLLALIIVLPTLSLEYGLLRMFQQLLFILSLQIVIAITFVSSFMKQQKMILFTGIIAIIFFLNLTGFISHLTGDYYPQMTLDNSGSYYDAYYVHKSDVLAIVWLSKNNVNHQPVVSSKVSELLTYGNIYALNDTFPPTIPKKAYVYLEVSSDRVVSMGKYTLIYNSSKPFLDNNKNLLYSNGKDNIYK